MAVQMDDMLQRLAMGRCERRMQDAYEILSKPCPDGCVRESWLEGMIELAKIHLNSQRWLEENER